MATQYRRKALMDQFGMEDDPNAPDVPNPIPPPPEIGGMETMPTTETPATSAPAAAPNYRDQSTVNLAGWDPTRTDNTGKMEFGRFAQSKGGHVTGDDIRAFVAQNPDEWELDPRSSANDPHIRQKQAWLDNPANNDGKTGARSIWQDVIRDAGPGGANAAAFSNVEGDPALGYEAPQAGGAVLGGDGLAGPMSNLNGLLQGNPMAAIQAEIAKLMQGGTKPNLQALLSQFGGGV